MSGDGVMSAAFPPGSLVQVAWGGSRWFVVVRWEHGEEYAHVRPAALRRGHVDRCFYGDITARKGAA